MPGTKIPSKEIYKVINEFPTNADWIPFVLDFLKLTTNEINDIVDDHSKDGRKEQRYQMVERWQTKNGGRVATAERLWNLVAQYRKVETDTETVNSQGASATFAKVVEQPSDQNSSRIEQTINRPGKMLPEDQPPFTNDEPVALCNLKSVGSQPQKVKATAEVVGREGKFNVKQMLQPLLNKASKNDNKTNPSDAANACEKVDKVRVLRGDEKAYETILKQGHYPIDSFHTKGCVLIMNNAFKGKEHKERCGSELDVRNMKALWEGLGCQPRKVIVKENKSAAEMKKILQDFSGKISRKYNLVVIVIMSHGEKDENGDQVFLGDDSRQVKVDFVLDLFNNENAKQLQHIPKIFLFQCCRGVQTDIGIQRDGPNAGKNNDDFQEYLKRKIGKPVTGCIERDGPGVRANRSPVYSDQLVAYATHDGFVALRNAENGSWFINAITNIFMEHAKDEHVVDLLTKVNKAVKEKEGQIKQEDGSMIPCKEMSGFVSNLTEKLYLFPGYPPNDEDIEGI